MNLLSVVFIMSWESKSFFAIALGLFFTASILFASEETELSPDAVLLDKLVEKNLISEDEARECKKNIAEQPIITSPNLNKVRFGGYSQWRYYSMWQDYNSPYASGKISENDFSMPRLVIKVFADLQDDMTSILALNLAAPEVFDTYFIRKKVDGEFLKGILDVGYSAPDFHMESTNGGRLRTLDRCILNTYWGGKDMGFDEYDYSSNAKQCFSGNHMGIFWQGKFPFDERFFYNISIANAKGAYYWEMNHDIGVSYWGSLGYATVSDDLDLKCGINFGYSSNLFSVYDTTGGGSKECSCLGVCPYLIMQYKNLYLHTESVVSNMEYGKILSDDKPIYTTKSGDTMPYGIMIMVGYTIDIGSWGKLEPLFRFSYLYTDGGGVAEGNVLAKANSPNGYYNRAFAYYGGLNWYINSYYTKVMLGVEHLRFSDSPTRSYAKSGVANMIGLQLQLEY